MRQKRIEEIICLIGIVIIAIWGGNLLLSFRRSGNS